jgi:hypothetical protein
MPSHDRVEQTLLATARSVIGSSVSAALVMTRQGRSALLPGLASRQKASAFPMATLRLRVLETRRNLSRAGASEVVAIGIRLCAADAGVDICRLAALCAPTAIRGAVTLMWAVLLVVLLLFLLPFLPLLGFGVKSAHAVQCRQEYSGGEEA